MGDQRFLTTKKSSRFYERIRDLKPKTSTDGESYEKNA